MSTIAAYHGTIWNVARGLWFPEADPLVARHALEFRTDLDEARMRALDLRDYDSGEIEVVFRADVDLDRADRHGDEIWVMDPSALSAQMARAVLEDDRWTDWMPPAELWIYLLDTFKIEPDTPPLAMIIGLAAKHVAIANR